MVKVLRRLKYWSLQGVNRFSPRAACLSSRNMESGGTGERREVHGKGRRRRNEVQGRGELGEIFFSRFQHCARRLFFAPMAS